MRTLHFGLHVADLGRSLAFYTALGYEIVGEVPETELGRLTMLKLPGDDFVAIELVSNPRQGEAHGTGPSHFVIQVASLHATLTALAAKGVKTEHPGASVNPDDPRTAWVTDPDGNRIELVQWPPGHPDGITAADWSA